VRPAPAALATALVLSGLRTVGAEPCPPRAALDGDGVAVERVAEELRRLGVSVASDASASSSNGCSVVRARVELDTNGGIAVAVQGATRGSEGRVVSDATLAAAWIDSWTREDVDNALWAAPATSRAPTHQVATVDQPLVAPVDVAPAPPASRWERFALSAGYEQTWSDDDAAWSGASAAACVRVGGFCVGGRARIAFDPERLHNATGVARNEMSVLATASYPLAIGTMSIAPELGVGVGRLSTRRAEAACNVMLPPNCSPMDPMCVPQPTCPSDPGTTMTPKVYVGDSFSAATYAPRIAFALRVAVPLFEHVWLDGLAGLTYAPFAHGSVFATGSNEMIAPELVALPGEPSTGYLLGIGIRVGAK